MAALERISGQGLLKAVMMLVMKLGICSLKSMTYKTIHLISQLRLAHTQYSQLIL